MTSETLTEIEALAARLWKAQIEGSGTSQNAINRRTLLSFGDEGDGVRETFRRYAAAVLELVGPKPLQFADETGDGVLTSLKARTFYRCFPQENGSFFVSHCGFYPTIKAAQAAAQAHADAAHWANTKLGDIMIDQP